jgi:alkaline phosphatase
MNNFSLSKIILAATLSLTINMTGIAQKNHAKSNNKSKPTNIILLIGDGMGLTQLYSGFTMNHGQLNLTKFKSIGFSETYSASDYITDSGAGGTAISTGNKTYNGAIGVNKDSVTATTILEYAEDNGLSTGLVVTSTLTDATPASFIAHQKSRYLMENIAADFLKTDIDVFVGGGLNYFTTRHDNRNLLNELRSKGYQVILSMDSIKNITQGKLAGFTANDNNSTISEGRGDMLPDATKTALNILSNNKKGFFLMVEGSLIDKVAHMGKGDDVAREVIDFDKAIGNALEFAQKNGNTLVIVTADHETGGMTIIDGDYEAGTLTAKFSATNHTGIMVPVFAYGPGAEIFQGIQENTEIFDKMMLLLGLSSGKQVPEVNQIQ